MSHRAAGIAGAARAMFDDDVASKFPGIELVEAVHRDEGDGPDVIAEFRGREPQHRENQGLRSPGKNDHHCAR